MVRRIAGTLLGMTICVAAGAQAIHDPTRPTDASAFFGKNTADSNVEWKLQSILYAQDRRVAVINGTRVHEGDRIGSAKVMRISSTHVLLKTGGSTLTLHLLPKTLKVRP